MAPSTNQICGSALLRVSGFPVRLWLAAADPQTFALIRQQNDSRGQYGVLGQQLAQNIGTELIPQKALTRAERHLALDIRRQLHNGVPLSATKAERFEEICRRLLVSNHQIVHDLQRVGKLSVAIETLEAKLSDCVDQYERRLPKLAAELFTRTPVAQTLLHDRNRTVYQEIQDLLKSGCEWNTKPLKQLGEYLWKIVDRAATNSTPRDWHAHVALLSISEDSEPLKSITLTSEVATGWSKNIHSQRIGLLTHELTDSPAASRLAITPLHWENEDRLEFVVSDPANPIHVSEVSLKRTSLLTRIYEKLAPGARTWKELESSLRSEIADEEELELLQKFTEHLIALGVLQISSPPQDYSTSWHCLTASSAEASYPRGADDGATNSITEWSLNSNGSQASRSLKSEGFLDVYRRTEASLPFDFCLRLQDSFGQAQRLLIAMQADRVIQTATTGAVINEQARPLLEILRQRISDSEGTHENSDEQSTRNRHWSISVNENSSYARLLKFIAARADEATTPIDLDRHILDELGLPHGMYDWPVDCILRVAETAAGFAAVLDEAFPAGSLDARFVGQLRKLQPQIRHADDYHHFLELLERKSGTTFLEVLIPPLSLGAANAVRRPIYTRTWTGDADAATYCDIGRDREYIPLGSISLRRVGNRLLAEANGRSVCPMYHATRQPLAPWNIIADNLLAASPLPMRWIPRRLHFSLDAFPERSYMPRITIDGNLVIACAQWRLSSSDLDWDSNLGTLDKLRRIERLRQQFQLPRWILITTEASNKPIRCDLESMRPIRTFDRLAKEDVKLLISEMLPAPDQLLVSDSDRDDRMVSAIMFRFPYDESPISMADRIAERLSRATT